MIFALDKESGELLALRSPLDAIARCKPIDVKDGFWLFFADDGSPLEARFEHRSHDDVDAPGPFALERAMSGLWLQERLERISAIEGCGLATVGELVETLKINRGKRVDQARRSS